VWGVQGIGEHCFTSCSHGNSFLVRLCTISHFSCHVHAFLDRDFLDHWIAKWAPIPWPPHSSDLTPLDFFFWEFVKDPFLLWKSAKCEWIAWQNHQSCSVCVTSEMLASTWLETVYCLDVCRATDGAHFDICWAHKKLCEVQHLKMY